MDLMEIDKIVEWGKHNILSNLSSITSISDVIAVTNVFAIIKYGEILTLSQPVVVEAECKIAPFAIGIVGEE